MNLNSIISMSARLYVLHSQWFILAGLIFFISSITSIGVLSGTMVTNGLIAFYFGASGTWIIKPLVLSIMVLTTLIGGIFSSFIFFSAFGAFMHTCAKIGAGRKDVSIILFLEYMQELGNNFWIIGITQQIIAFVISIPFLVLDIFLFGQSQMLGIIGLFLALFVWTIAQVPFVLAFPIEIIRKGGAFGSLKFALYASTKSPISTIILLIGVYLLLTIPMITLIFYPVYLFFIFAPFTSILMLTYYEAISGWIK